MGWKAIKEAFGITKHTVSVGARGIYIGSGFVSDLVVINTTTGVLFENETFKGHTLKAYPALCSATPAELLELIRAQDTFSADIPVYTYQDAEIIEKSCETPGWPNNTHDGELMRDNTFSTDRNTVIGWAKRSARLRVEAREESVEELRQTLAKAEADLDRCRGFAQQLEAEHPSIHEVDS